MTRYYDEPFEQTITRHGRNGMPYAIQTENRYVPSNVDRPRTGSRGLQDTLEQDSNDVNKQVQRRRIPIACDRCRKRKIRCSGQQRNGGCQNCKTAGNDNCQFNRVQARELCFADTFAYSSPGTVFQTPLSTGRASAAVGDSGYKLAKMEPSSLDEKQWHYGFDEWGARELDARDINATSRSSSPSVMAPSLKRKRDSVSESVAQKAQKLPLPPSGLRKSTSDARTLSGNNSVIRRLDFGAPSTGRYRNPNADTPVQRVLRSFADTSNTGEPITFTNPQEGDYPITQTILYQLNEPGVPYAMKQKVQMILNAHALQVSGIEKGRDITRLALKKRNEKVAELEQKIQQLEQERELDKTVIRHFKRDMTESVAAKRGKGGGSKG